MVDSEVKSILNKAYKEALKILKANKTKLEDLAKLLMEQETVNAEEFQELLNKKATPKAT